MFTVRTAASSEQRVVFWRDPAAWKLERSWVGSPRNRFCSRSVSSQERDNRAARETSNFTLPPHVSLSSLCLFVSSCFRALKTVTCAGSWGVVKARRLLVKVRDDLRRLPLLRVPLSRTSDPHECQTRIPSDQRRYTSAQRITLSRMQERAAELQ